MSELRERILAKALFLNRVEYYVEAWGETVYFQELSGKSFEDFLKSTYKDVDGVTQAEPMVAVVNMLYYSLVDENGERLFNKTQLRSINGMVLIELGKKAAEISGLDNQNTFLEATDELKKTQEDDSITD